MNMAILGFFKIIISYYYAGNFRDRNLKISAYTFDSPRILKIKWRYSGLYSDNLDVI